MKFLFPSVIEHQGNDADRASDQNADGRNDRAHKRDRFRRTPWLFVRACTAATGCEHGEQADTCPGSPSHHVWTIATGP